MPNPTPETGPFPQKFPLLQVCLLAFIPLVAWAGLISKLTTDWSTNPQYEFGYFVPVFILYLLARRWFSRPTGTSQGQQTLYLNLGLAIILLLLPMRVIQEANPDWRPFNWIYASVVVALSLIPFALAGGTRWIRHFAFPFLLIFSALAWPLATEQAVLQGLSAAVTAATVELLNLANIPALQRGNVIDIAAGSVGIADACSGIRSLAGTLMASLFFGEFYRLGAAKRIFLVLGGCLIAFGLNLCRAYFLSWRAASEGIHSIEKWHDSAGFTIFAISFASLWLLVTRMARNRIPEQESGPEQLFTLPAIRPVYLAVGSLWILSIYSVSDFWYKKREGERPSAVEWELHWPQMGKSIQFVEIPQETRSILRFTTGRSAMIDWNDGSAWQLFFFRWAPGRSSVQLATMHRPEVCLPAIGYKFVKPVETIAMPVSQISIPFTGSLFECNGKPVYVYRCLWEDFQLGELTRNQGFDMSIRGRLLAAWYGRRNLGQRMLQVAMIGLNTEADAQNQLRSKLAGLVVLKS